MGQSPTTQKVKSIKIKLFAAGLLALSTNPTALRAEEPYKPAETLGKSSQDPRVAAQSGMMRVGTLHTNGLGKPCLEYELTSRAHAAIPEIFDYILGIRNLCPKPIKLRICPKNSYDCNGVAVRPYERKEVVMGFGPYTDRFAYKVKEIP